MSAERKPDLDLEQIQGLVLNGYRHHTAARVCRCSRSPTARAPAAGSARLVERPPVRRVPEDAARRAAVHQRRLHQPRVHASGVRGARTCIPIGARGLQPALPGGTRGRRAARAGWATTGRATRACGRGAAADQPVHGLLAVFGSADGEGYAALQRDHRREPRASRTACGRSSFARHHARGPHPSEGALRLSRRDREPARSRASRRRHSTDIVANGEMLLGYENSYGHFPMSPEVPADTDQAGALATAADRPARARTSGGTAAISSSGSSSQDVRAFWQYVYAAKDGVPGLAGGPRGGGVARARGSSAAGPTGRP